MRPVSPRCKGEAATGEIDRQLKEYQKQSAATVQVARKLRGGQFADELALLRKFIAEADEMEKASDKIKT